MGRSFAPAEPREWATIEAASEKIDRLIRHLSALPSEASMQALDALAVDPDLAHWRGRLERARDDQRLLHRDAAYRHPNLEQLHRALANEQPANAGDLAALLLDRLRNIASTIRTGNSDDWRQYWNEDSYGRADRPKHEDSCRGRAALPTPSEAPKRGGRSTRGAVRGGPPVRYPCRLRWLQRPRGD